VARGRSSGHDAPVTERVVLLGPPGSGKGTQGKRLAAALGTEHVSSGDLLRASVSAEDPHGVGPVMARGGLVDDATLHRILLDELPEAFVLDGYPRTSAQAAALDLALGPRRVGAVVELEVPEEVLLPRLLERAQRHGRRDDTPETIAFRFDVFRGQIASLARYYGARLVRVDGVGTPDEVFERLLAACR
jgi:adenylate kinase